MARDITQLHPTLQQKAAELLTLCKQQGLIVKVTSCVRDEAEQAECVKNKTSSVYYPNSHHNWGTAFDFCRNDGKGAYNDSDGFFTKVGRIGESIGLEWGGSWVRPVDKPHFQMPDWGTGTAKLKSLYGTPDKFRATWGSAPAPAGQLVVDGVWGKATTRRLQEVLGTPADGIVSEQWNGWQARNPGLTSGWEWKVSPSGGSRVIRALQTKLGIVVDGLIGPDTIEAMQAWLGTPQDGYVSNPSQAVKALQRWLNEQA